MTLPATEDKCPKSNSFLNLPILQIGEGDVGMAKKPSHEDLQRELQALRSKVAETASKVAETASKDDRIRRLNLVLRTIRNVNQLLVKEKDRAELLQGICENLVANRGYFNAWIALFDQSRRLTMTAEAGLGRKFNRIIRRLKSGRMSNCSEMALSQSKSQVLEDPARMCAECPLAADYVGRGAMAVRLEYSRTIYGMLTVSIPREFIRDEEERELLEEIAGDISFALHNIAASEERERALEEVDQIFDLSFDMICIAGFDGSLQRVNPAFERILGYAAEDLLEKSYFDFVHPAHMTATRAEVGRISSGTPAVHFENRLLCKDGSYKWFGWTASPNLESRLMYIAGRDISNQKQLEDSLRRQTLHLMERVKELNCLYSLSRLMQKRNVSLEMILQGAADLIPAAWQYPEITCARVVFEGNEWKTENYREGRWKQTSDILVRGEIRGKVEVLYLEERPDCDEGPFLSDERKLINAVAERLGRVIERLRAEQALEKSEKRFRRLTESAPIGVSIIQDDEVVYQNPEQEGLLGPLPRPSRLADFKNIHPDDVEKVKQLHHDVGLGNSQRRELEFRLFSPRKGGSCPEMRWVYCRTTPIEYRGKNAALVNMIDISRVKEMEQLLRVQDKMTSLGRVAAGIAHEIRNPLSGINIYLNTLEKIYGNVDNSDKIKGIIRQMQSASHKIESIIKRVMDFSKPTEPKRILTDINQPIKEAIDLSSVTLRKSGVTMESDLAEDLPRCFADPQLIEEVTLNLITNAAEAMKNMQDSKKLGIATRMEADRIIITISDSGPGVPVHLRERVLDPFYSTKNGSTGIGLSISHRIIRDHRGTLKIAESKWGGAEFTIEIPLQSPEEST